MTIIWVRVDESWFLMKHQIIHHQVFIWNETWFSSLIKYFQFYCFVWEYLSKKGGSCFITGSKHLRPRAFICISVFGTRNEAPYLSFWHITSNTSLSYTASWSAATETPGFSLFWGGVGVTSISLCGISYVVSGGSHLGVFYSSQQLIIFVKQLPLNLTTNCAKYFATS